MSEVPTFMTHRHVQAEMVQQPSTYIPVRREHKRHMYMMFCSGVMHTALLKVETLCFGTTRSKNRQFSADIKLDKGIGHYVQQS